MKKGCSILSIVICSVFLISACAPKQAAVENIEKEAINVETSTVNLESIDTISALSGTLEPYEETDVSFPIGGIVNSLKVEVGDAVKEGNLLSSVQDDDAAFQKEQANNSALPAEAALLSAEAAINASEAGVQSANAQINSANASLAELDSGVREQEKEQAKIAVDRAKEAYEHLLTNFERTKALYEQGVVSQKDYEAMQFQLSSAEKDVANAEAAYSLILEGATEAQRSQALANISAAESGKAQAEAALEQSKASKEQAQAAYDQAQIGVERAELALSKAKLKAPMSGVVLQKHISKGEIVNAGTPVYTIGRMDQLKLLLPVSDKKISEWKIDDEAQVSLYDEVRTGKVAIIYPETNAGTGTINVEIVIPNSEKDWLPGQVVKANRVTKGNTGILVPVEAVLSSSSNPYVFKEVKSHAVKTTVKTGSLVGNKIHIVSGLKEGDLIVVRGGELLLDGDSIKSFGGKTK